MRLMKLFTLAGMAYIGYLVYQDVQERMEAHGWDGPRELLEDAMSEETGRMQTLTGGGRGASESVADVSGGQRNVNVGRGVKRS